MENNLIGAQIAKFRKAANLTQEELGRAVGVSTQAVSRWECGGAPDVTLLPAIADRLGVSIDALFGRENGQLQNVPEQVRRWAYGLPKQQVIEEMTRLVWSVMSQLAFDEFEEKPMPYLTGCENSLGKGTGVLTYSSVAAQEGLYFGMAAEDLSFAMLCPRPEKGYAAYFADRDKLRRIFSLLAAPGCLEATEYLLSNQGNYSAEALAAGIGADPAEVERLLKKMAENGIAETHEVTLLEGKKDIFRADHYASYVPFMYLARHLGETPKINYLNIWLGDIPKL